jgi:hypothetical protein
VLTLTPGCNGNALTGSKLALANYDEVTNGMTKANGSWVRPPPPKPRRCFKKTTYRYEEGSKFALLTFKNDELDSKESNLATP